MKKIAFWVFSLFIIVIHTHIAPYLSVSRSKPSWINSSHWIVNRCITEGNERSSRQIDQIIAIPMFSNWLSKSAYVLYSDRTIYTSGWIDSTYLQIHPTYPDLSQNLLWYEIDTSTFTTLPITRSDLSILGGVPPYWMDEQSNRYIIPNLDFVLINNDVFELPKTIQIFYSKIQIREKWNIDISPSHKYLLMYYNSSDFLLMETNLENPVQLSNEWNDFVWSNKEDLLIGLNHDGSLYQIDPVSFEMTQITDPTNATQYLDPDTVDILAWSSTHNILVYRTHSELTSTVPRNMLMMNLSTGDSIHIGSVYYTPTVVFVDDTQLIYWNTIPVEQQPWYEPAQKRLVAQNIEGDDILITKQLVSFDVISMQERVVFDPDWVRLGNHCIFSSDFAIFEP